MSGRLAQLEVAEQLVVELLESAGQAVAELKEIQANDAERRGAFLAQTDKYCEALKNIKDIVIGELNSLTDHLPPPVRRPGIDQLAILEWETKVVADNLHELLPPG
jgi:hypothetical protein